nr:GNAT family N-acetyltransferase [Micromonospora sp. DSM 115978]
MAAERAPESERPVRPATASDARIVANLLDAFNREFDTPTPGVGVLAARLERLLTGEHFAVLLAGEPGGPAAGVAVLTFRPSLWYPGGRVATLDELYVRPDLRGRRYGHALLVAAQKLARQHGAGSLEINVDGEDTDARRFYEAHGFTNVEPGAPEPMYYYYRDLD